MRVSEAAKRWLVPAGLLATLAGLAVGGVLLGADNPLLAILVVPAVAIIVAAPRTSIARRPDLSLDASVGGTSTSQRPDGARIVSYAEVILFLKNAERSGDAKHVKVELSTVAAPDFRPAKGAQNATRNLIDGDTWRVVWQPGPLGPGAERELPLRSAEFAFDDSVSAKVRVTAERMDPVESNLELRVSRYQGQARRVRRDGLITESTYTTGLPWGAGSRCAQ